VNARITIVTPSFNQGRYIERTVQSVLSQPITGIEYFVMDGGSTDDTSAVLQKYTTQLHFISEPDHGQAHAINKGLKKATSDIIGWLNSDDIYYPNALPVILDFFAKNPEIDIVYGDVNHIDEHDKIFDKYPVQAWNFQELKKICYISQPAVFFRSRIIQQYGLLDESLHFCMDYEYWLRLGLCRAKFAYLPVTLAGTRLYQQTKTLSAPMAAHRETLQMLRRRLGKVPVIWLINHASLLIKQKTIWRYPEWRFVMAMWAVTSYLTLVYNGIFRGIKSLLTVPIRMLAIHRKKNEV